MFKFHDYFNSGLDFNPKSADGFNEIVANDKISLASRSFGDDLLTSSFISLKISLNESLEIIGSISFHSSSNDDLFFGGNVSYYIEEKFRNQGYATMALKLLKEALKNNKYALENGLVIATVPDNIYSQKVALNNNGHLIYEGSVPKDNLLYSLDHVENVKVYKIDLQDKKK